MSSKIVLYPHNEKGYNELIEGLEKYQIVGMDRATGTGKSFIMLKYLYENRHKRILYLAPTYAIIDQLINAHMADIGINKKEFPCLDTNIYYNILNMDMEELARNYDIIILDEYHRCGAKKCVTKILELKEIIFKKYPNKKIIGTTATSIRYLDHNKDMNKIIFDGHMVAKLSLADAILQGILPIFEYVISDENILQELKKIQKKVDKYLVYGELDKNILDKINRLNYLVEKNMIGSKPISEMVPDKGKILVFSSTVKQIKRDQKLISKIFKNKKYDEYVISYHNPNEKNLELLSKFRNALNSIISILFSINIMNEGVHVKDIVAIFMLRLTTSPIIYFQELGRLLSYSRNREKAIVFDLKNNIGRNKVMYELFNEVRSRARELLVTDPENRERYEKILREFKIIDNSEIFTLLEELKEITSYDNLISNRINNAIKVLQSNDSKFESYKMQAYLDIFYYQKYITVNQFEQIMLLPIDKPSIFNLTKEQFSNYLQGSKNIKEKTSLTYSNDYLKVLEFYEYNYHLPSVFSDNVEESALAKKFLLNYSLCTNRQQKKIVSLCDDYLSSIEILSYNEEIDGDFNDIYEQIDYFLENGLYINENIVLFLEKINNEKSNEYLNKIGSSVNISRLNYIDNIDNDIGVIDRRQDNKILKEKLDVSDEILFRSDFREKMTFYLLEYNNCTNKKQYIDNLYQELLNFIRIYHHLPQYKENEIDLYFKKIVFNEQLESYSDKINEFLLENKKHYIETQKEKLKRDLIIFMQNNNGGLPMLNVSEEETRLYNQYQEFSEYFNELDRQEIKSCEESLKRNRIEIVYQYISFINKKGRRPMITSNDEDEIKLVYSYYRIKELLDEREIRKMKQCESKLTRYQESKRLYLEMLEERGKGKR